MSSPPLWLLWIRPPSLHRFLIRVVVTALVAMDSTIVAALVFRLPPPSSIGSACAAYAVVKTQSFLDLIGASPSTLAASGGCVAASFNWSHLRLNRKEIGLSWLGSDSAGSARRRLPRSSARLTSTSLAWLLQSCRQRLASSEIRFE
jgi:hypothetical protein